MPHVSKQKLNQRVWRSIYSQFIVHVVSHGRKQQRKEVIEDLLTETEKTMLAKRFAIILFLIEGKSYYWIQKVLKVSSSTVSRIDSAIETGSYKSLVKHFSTSKHRDDFWKTVETIFRGGLPKQGADRWEWLNEAIAAKRE